MPPHLLLVPVLLVALVFLLIIAARSRRNATATTSTPKRESEEVRLLRLQVATLTDALREATGKGSDAATPGVDLTKHVETPATDVEAPVTEVAVEPEPEPLEPELGHQPEPEPAFEPVRSVPVEVEPLVTDTLVFTAPVVEPPLGARPVVESRAWDTTAADHTAHAYTDLSRSLARSGRLREAALAQWAADLRVLGPLLEGRGAELCAAVADLAGANASAMVTEARAAASALVGPSVSVTAMLPDASHLKAPNGPAARSTYFGTDVSADVLADHQVRALETVLVAAAEDAGDHRGVSVGLRCDLVAHVVTGHHSDETADLIRDVLEPHERPLFDAALATDSAGRAS